MKKSLATLTMIGIMAAVMISVSGCTTEFYELPLPDTDEAAVADADSSQRNLVDKDNPAQRDSLMAEMPTDIACIDGEEVAYELKIRFVDNEGNDLLNPNHPATINGTYIIFNDGKIDPPNAVSWKGYDRNYFTDDNGGYVVIKGVVKPQQFRTVYLTWAEGYHRENLIVRYQSGNTYVVDYNNKLYGEGKEISFSTYKDRTPNIAPIAIPINIMDADGYSSLLAKGEALYGCDIKVRYEGKDYPVDWTDHGAMSTDMISLSGGFSGYGDAIASSKIKPDFFGAAYFSQVMPDVSEGDPMNYPVVGFGYFDKNKDFTAEIEVVGSTPLGDFSCPVKVVNKVTMIADYPSSETTYFYNGQKISYLGMVNVMK